MKNINLGEIDKQKIALTKFKICFVGLFGAEYPEHYKMVANVRQQGSKSPHSGEFKFQILPSNSGVWKRRTSHTKSNGASVAEHRHTTQTPTNVGCAFWKNFLFSTTRRNPALTNDPNSSQNVFTRGNTSSTTRKSETLPPNLLSFPYFISVYICVILYHL